MQERVQKILSAHGIASRRFAEKLILDGKVLVNGKIAALGDKTDITKDRIEINGVILKPKDAPVYIALNKPRGYVTTMHDDRGRKTVADLVSDLPYRVYPVGRLDLNSEGLLIMTNDGETANRLMHPSFESEKTYHVTVSGLDVTAAISNLQKEIVIEGYKIKPAKVEFLHEREDKFKLSITIHEGRNRQIRKMCLYAGLKVHRLVRVSQGIIKLGELKSGTWRFLTDDEIAYLHSL